MINLTKDIIIIQSGEDLERSIKDAITQAKGCVCKELFNTNHISPSKVSSSSRNEYYNASVVRLFDDHLNTSTSPVYDENWVRNVYNSAGIRAEIKTAKEIVPTTSHAWLNKSSLERLGIDCLLLLHFLWQNKAVLLPADLKKPTIGHPETKKKGFEFAASTYTEVLALVSQPFVPHVSYEDMPDITTVMKESAIKNFGWYAWRMIRCTDWHRIEDINPKDISDLANHIILTGRGEADWFMYPIAPAAFWNYVQKLYPERHNKEVSLTPRNTRKAGRKALVSGEFTYPAEHTETVESWLNYQKKFVQLLKARGMKQYSSYEKSFALLNTYLFSDFILVTGMPPPRPNELNRRHLDGDEFEGLLSFLRKGRSKSGLKVALYHLNALFDHMVVHSNADEGLAGFVNPISDIDYPVVRRRSGTNKPAFESEHFPHLLQYCYAIESFSTYLSEKVHNEQVNLYDSKYRADINANTWNDAQKVVQTEKFGYVPIVFYQNPLFDPAEPKSSSNRPMCYEPLHLIPRFVVPIIEHSVERKGKWVFYPQLNYIRHNIVALETGVRSIHIRWLEKRTYDMHIDRSRPLPPLCKLRINTDKVNDAWDATVSKNVIDLLDRQKEMLTWFDDPSLNVEVWYDNHEESPFGKIISIFPKGEVPGVLTPESYAKYFKRLIYSFDLFCRFQLGIDSTNAMPEALGEMECIDDPHDYLAALKLEAQACKLIEHTPHSCRVSVVSEYIRILPPNIIGAFLTGHASEEHVIYYAKLDPAYLKSVARYQKMSIEQDVLLDRPAMSSIRAEDVQSKLQQAFRRDKDKSLIDFGAISFDRENKDEVLSGIKAAKQRPIDSLAFMPTHICAFGNQCPADVIKDLGAVPGSKTPCGGCYYSIKTVDHLPRIHGHIRTLTDECSELESYIAEAKRNGASPQSLAQKASHRKYLASEIISWTVTAHCLEQMHDEIKTRSSFLIEKPEIVSEHLVRLELKNHSLSNLIARTSEAKSHAEYFTPQLKHQVMMARNKLLAFTGDFNRTLQEAPTGFTLIDEFRGLIRSACEVLGVSLHELSDAMNKPLMLDRPNAILRLVSSAGSVPA
ncbi:hypothetical protein [Pseudomonas syringae]|uniref:hypothetical protein n=1 Tax=Pseudomonas syringae TaxID=317 RepID=UPI0018E6250A|nr:hypothetical protein [Pseudomonas syringae]MBI6750751.1 hypothetical protein [Pseudomonas syringae]MBI6770534.1 hypothetical protein [Pseudomonas syringae]MBI6774086.1 hypothetical protein [Pseudomonas syringae]MBI6790884.1 hypothetical protein [Pseudomonas syringae]MBI6803715.1 hypothetical protein [Pseudomonas syringae]